MSLIPIQKAESSCSGQPLIEPKVDGRIGSIKDAALHTVRTSMPIETLFRPELKINLSSFISDQILFREIATLLKNLPPSCTDSGAIGAHFKGSELEERIKKMFLQDKSAYLVLFYEACADVIGQKFSKNMLQSAIEGRIFTLKNALIAQHTPDAILKSQVQNQILKQTKEEIQQEGADFIRRSLALHLGILEAVPFGSFKEELTAVAEQLIPFVRLVTYSYLKENGLNCSENPLTFRDPQGHNRQGLIASSVMEACLEALGYSTRHMERTDLDPRITMAALHGVVEVVGPDQKKYIVDPAYMQFHKDVLMLGQELPRSMVLVLEEHEVEGYVEKTLMPFWRSVYEKATFENTQLLALLKANGQHLIYILDKMKNIPQMFRVQNMQEWVKGGLTLLWTLSSYRHVTSDIAYQGIFNELGTSHNLIKHMEIQSLTTHLPLKEIANRLNELKKNKVEKNSLEALSLIAKLPREERAAYTSLLDADERAKQMDPAINAYFRSVVKVVNPGEGRFSAVYGCSGADAASVLLSTNATDLTFVDQTKVSLEEFKQGLTRAKTLDQELLQKLDKSSYFASKAKYSSSSSSVIYSELKGERHFMEELPAKLFIDLAAIGVDLDEVEITSEQGAIKITFPWEYAGSSTLKTRSLFYVTADITEPAAYPSILKNKLDAGIDAFFMKGAVLAPRQYPHFLPYIAKSLKTGGYLMTSDRTSRMETYDPEPCLKDNGFFFSQKKTEKIARFEELIAPPNNPLNPLFSSGVEREYRPPGSDVSYWTIVNIRQKDLQE